jgi:hypothetical protein
MRRTFVFSIAATAIVILLLAACGGDDDAEDLTGEGGPSATQNDSDAGGQPTDDGSDQDSPDAPSGGGTATLAIGDETWEFTGYYCAFGPAETQNDRVSFSSGAFGESAEGVRIQLDASIQDTREEGRYDGDGVIHSLTLNDIEDFENPSLGWSALTGILGSGGPFLHLDGQSVTAETVFDDETTDEIEEVPGTFQATCP